MPVPFVLPHRSYILVLLSLVPFALLACFQVTAHAQLMRNSAKECAICHFRWLDQFYVEGRGTDLVEYQKERVAGSEMICYSCHNGIMVDSRERFWAKRGHDCNMIPSKKVHIPPEMPLGEKGEVVCATCHTVHGVSDELRYQEPIYLRCRNSNSEMCILCHVTKAGGRAQGNHPINVAGITVPQKILDRYGRVGSKGEIICETCHTVHGTIDKNLLVIPDRLDTDTFTSELCEACHGSNPSRAERGAGMGSHPVDLPPRDARPPDVWEGGRRVALGKGGEIICETCHWPHDAAPRTSILAKRGGDAICLDCHTKKAIMAGTDHDLSITAPQAVNIVGKNISDAGICSPCHIPHNAGDAKLWARGTEQRHGGDVISPLCTSCHEQGKPATAKSTGRFSHPVGRGLERIGGKTDLPLFDRRGERSGNGYVACATCHDPHTWDPSGASSGPGIKMEGDRRNSFLRRADVPASSLCLSCHEEKRAIFKTEHDLSLSAPIEANSSGQTTETGGVCSPCHLVHNGTSIRIWAKDVQQQDFTITSICTSCHRPGGCGEKKLIGRNTHPTERDMSLLKADHAIGLPQYDRSGECAQIGGLVTCGSCHDPHQWSPGKKSSGPGRMLEGDGDSSFLRIVNDRDSSLCVQCHLTKGYVAHTEHDLMVTARKEINIMGMTADQSGVCGACHIPHNARGIRIFAKDIGKGGTPGNQLCESCHFREGCAREKVISPRTHPMAVRPKVSDLEFPLYDDQGRVEAEQGGIGCSTCHDPHQWDPIAEGRGEGKKSEGTGRDSFLRMTSAPESLLCRQCHPDEGSVAKTD
ncbi:MAG: cytochrome c3 family protein, partial [bacterium]